MAVDAVWTELVSAGISLITGKITGNRVILGHRHRMSLICK
jgi:hypothetical protein